MRLFIDSLSAVLVVGLMLYYTINSNYPGAIFFLLLLQNIEKGIKERSKNEQEWQNRT